jgi:AdoMet-dependent rRNA methyltransferase SPB1
MVCLIFCNNRFTSDENRHNKPTLPETKEAVQIMRERMRALDARPIKKVAEAKFRKQLRQERRIMKAAAKSQGLADQEDMSERSKLEQVAKVMGKAKKAVRTEKDKVKVVVAKGAHKAIQGRPRGIKGRYKVNSFRISNPRWLMVSAKKKAEL